jgi:hypothetical protein
MIAFSLPITFNLTISNVGIKLTPPQAAVGGGRGAVHEDEWDSP